MLVAIPKKVKANGNRPYAKGKNGYFDLDSVLIEGGVGSPIRGVRVHFYSNRSAYPGPCYAALDLVTAEAVGKAILKEVAEVKAAVNGDWMKKKRHRVYRRLHGGAA